MLIVPRRVVWIKGVRVIKSFVEAAHFAVRYDTQIKRWYQKKAAKRLPVVAIKAVAHKLARACYHILKTGEPFEVGRAFS